MSKYPKDIRDEAIKWFGLSTDEDDSIRDIALRIFTMRKTLGNKVKGLSLYSSVEIAEMIKDIDRNA